jgi:hypothetical protein
MEKVYADDLVPRGAVGEAVAELQPAFAAVAEEYLVVGHKSSTTSACALKWAATATLTWIDSFDAMPRGWSATSCGRGTVSVHVREKSLRKRSRGASTGL